MKVSVEIPDREERQCRQGACGPEGAADPDARALPPHAPWGGGFGPSGLFDLVRPHSTKGLGTAASQPPAVPCLGVNAVYH